MGEEVHDHNHDHDAAVEMGPYGDATSRRSEDQRAPLLVTDPTLQLPTSSIPDSTTYQSDSVRHVYARNSVRSRSALLVQTCGIAFVVLIWSLVIYAMPLTPLPLFGYHPLIQSLAFLLLLQAITTLQPTSHADATEKHTAFRLHRLVNAAAVLPLFTIGASIMWYLHHQPGAKHFISWHGTLGTLLVALTWLHVAGGIVVTAVDGVQTRALWKYHRLAGYVLLLAYTVVLFLGAAQTDWAQKNAGSTHHAAVLLCLVGAIVAVLSRTQWSKLPAVGRS